MEHKKKNCDQDKQYELYYSVNQFSIIISIWNVNTYYFRIHRGVRMNVFVTKTSINNGQLVQRAMKANLRLL